MSDPGVAVDKMNDYGGVEEAERWRKGGDGRGGGREG